jgi:hypothetical protein
VHMSYFLGVDSFAWFRQYCLASSCWEHCLASSCWEHCLASSCWEHCLASSGSWEYCLGSKEWRCVSGCRIRIKRSEERFWSASCALFNSCCLGEVESQKTKGE